MSSLLSEVGTAITSVIGWVGSSVTSIISTDGELHALLPLLAIGIGVTFFWAGMKVVRSFTFGA